VACPAARAALLAMIVLALASRAAAQGPPTIGSGPFAMPALHRVLVANETEPGVDVSSMGGYGYTEDVLGRGDAHHRALGSLAVAGRPLSWLTIAGRVDGRWDHHLLSGADDQSAVGEARLALRGDWLVAPGLSLGLAGIVFVPGADAPSLVFEATTVDARGLVSYTPDGASVTLALDLGFRFDRSAYGLQRPLPYGSADLVSLGASDSNAVLLGGGVVGRIDDTELFGEVTADLLVDRGLAASPVRIAAGARVPIVPRLLSLHAALEAGVGGRSAVDAASVLTPIEPRFAIVVGLVLAPRSAPVEPLADDTTDPSDPTPGEIRGRVRDPSGSPITGARVRVVDAQELSATTDSEGAYVLRGVPPGASLTVEADGYVAQVGASGEVVLERALPEGALRGLVRAPRGSVSATITVEPGGAVARTDADGVFELALAPGHYTLTIEARGHATQHREVDIEVGGVTVLNVDLQARHR
jgi:hypothetical protein